MSQAFIVDVVRSPMARGKANGALASVHPSDLLAQVLTGLVERTGIDPGEVDDFLVGCVAQAGVQSATPGRQAWLSAGYPVHVPSVTIERKCGSGQQALDFAVQGVIAGSYDIAIAGGVESMSQVPIGMSAVGADPIGPGARQRFPGLVNQGVAAELVSEKYRITREELDVYSARSHRRAADASSLPEYREQIIPITTLDGEKIEADETIRPATTPEALSGLRPAFASSADRERFPDLEWKITAGNASQVTDGAGAVLIMSEQALKRSGLKPRAKIIASTVVGDDPTLMLTGPIPATHKVLAKAGLRIDDMATNEVNEAFACVPLAWQQEFNADPERLNPWGGAIALGHPLGASGIRLFGSMLARLEHTSGRYGLQTMCEAGGMANAMVIERLA